MAKPPSITRFLGMTPRLTDWQTSWDWAEFAIDVDLSRGTLRAFRTPLLVAGAALTDRDFRVDSLRCTKVTYAACMDIVDPLPSASPGNCGHPVYATGHGTTPLARSYDGGNTWTGSGFDLAGFRLTTPLTVATYTPQDMSHWQSVDAENATQMVESVAFACTLTGADPNEESSLGAAVTIDNVNPGGSVTLSGLPTTVPAGYPAPATVRVYMARSPLEQGGEGSLKANAAWTIAAEVVFGTGSVTIPMQAMAGPGLIYPRADPAPAGLTDLCAHRDGTMSGRTATQICFSDKLRPHAWPQEYQIGTFDRLRKWIAGQSFGYALTDDQPIIIGITKIDDIHRKVTIVEDSLPITWPRSAAVWHSSVVYASRDGLVLLQPNGSYRILSAHFWTPNQWRELNAQQLIGVCWDGYYWGFSPRVSFRLRLPEAAYGDADPELIYLSARPIAVQVENDHLYLMMFDPVYGQGIFRWNEGDALMPYSWRSKGVDRVTREYQDAYLVKTDGQVTITHIADGRQIAVHANVSGVRRFPVGTEPAVYTFQVDGTGEVELFALSEDVYELAA